MNIDLNKFGEILSTRDLGRRVRLEIIDAFDKGEQVNLDMSKVKLISSAFADELFGILSETIDWAKLRASLTVIYPPEMDRESLLRKLIQKAVFDRRKNKSKF